MGFVKMLQGLFSALNKILGGLQRSEDKKAGARQADLAARNKADEQARNAKKVRADSPRRTKRQHLDRM